MFRMVKTLTTWWPVKVYEPSPEKPGTFAEYEFEIEMEILDRDVVKFNQAARDAILAEAEGEVSDKVLKSVTAKLDQHELQVFHRVFRNWRGVVDETGEVLPFSTEMFLQALKRNHFREAINVAYAEAIDSGKARLGN